MWKRWLDPGQQKPSQKVLRRDTRLGFFSSSEAWQVFDHRTSRFQPLRDNLLWLPPSGPSFSSETETPSFILFFFFFRFPFDDGRFLFVLPPPPILHLKKNVTPADNSRSPDSCCAWNSYTTNTQKIVPICFHIVMRGFSCTKTTWNCTIWRRYQVDGWSQRAKSKWRRMKKSSSQLDFFWLEFLVILFFFLNK